MSARPLPVLLLLSSSSCARPQPRVCEFSVACRTSTAILWVQCGGPDLNGDPVRSVWRAGPQPRVCEFSVACRTSNCDPVSSVWRAGPQLRSCEFSVACRTSTAECVSSVWRAGPQTGILWVQCGVPDLNRDRVTSVWGAGSQLATCVRKNVRRYVRKNVVKICQRECQKICQKECQKVGRTRSSGGQKMYDVVCAVSGWSKNVWCARLCSCFKLRMFHVTFRTLNELYRYFQGKVQLRFTLTTPTRHVMVGITRSKVIKRTLLNTFGTPSTPLVFETASISKTCPFNTQVADCEVLHTSSESWSWCGKLQLYQWWRDTKTPRDFDSY